MTNIQGYIHFPRRGAVNELLKRARPKPQPKQLLGFSLFICRWGPIPCARRQRQTARVYARTISFHLVRTAAVSDVLDLLLGLLKNPSPD